MEIPQNCKTIFVRNLPYDLTEDEIGDKFKPCGDIKSIRMVFNHSNRNFKGFCYLEFEEHSALLKALNLNGKMVKGREMIVDFEDSGPKMGFKYRSEKPSKFNKEYRDVMKKSLQKKRKRTGQQ
jgi:nucleolin